VIRWTKLNAGRRLQSGHRRAIHFQDIVAGAIPAHWRTGSDDVVYKVNTAAAQRIAVDCIPLPIHRRFGDAGISARERHAEIVRARGAEIDQRQIVEIQAPILIDRYLAVAAAVAGGDFTFQRRRADNPFEGFAAIQRMPNPARVGGEGTRRARINAIRICRIDANRFLEPGSTNAGNDRMAERWRIREQKDVGI
jgi:hypothetical protein